ncbi:MAG: aminopeptidase P family N-terminal domain-containing protein, partial [Kiritimatiellae bacterium]|nr:aminopeptidase P family N-terminal domain-containing protein [Kiritimatiellia bacterium]
MAKNNDRKNGKPSNPFAGRLAEFCETLAEKKLDAAVIENRASIFALTGVECDSASLVVEASGGVKLHTDFRYTVEIARKAPGLALGDINALSVAKPFAPAVKKAWRSIGCEFSLSHSRFLSLRKAFPGAKLSDVAADVAALRAVKTPEEIEALRRSTALNDAIWAEAQTLFKPGMSEIDMARAIKS